MALRGWQGLWILHNTFMWKFHFLSSGDGGVSHLQGWKGFHRKQGRGCWSFADGQ